MAKKAKVLLVAQDQLLLELLQQNLSKSYEISTTSCTNHELEDEVKKAPNIIILDAMMPGHQGLGVGSQIRRWSQVAVLMLTLGADEREFRELDLTNLEDSFTEPFSVEALEAKIKGILSRKVPATLEN